MRIVTVGFALAAVVGLTAASLDVRSHQPHNIIIFVADGLRAEIVTPETAPALARVRDEGVNFTNSHSVYPTVTTVNAAALATGHLPGDNGDFANTLYLATKLVRPNASPFAGLEDDDTLGLMNDRFGGSYLNETTLLALARARGYQTAVIGKHGPAAIQDVTARHGESIVIDDRTGSTGSGAQGLPLPEPMKAALIAAGLGAKAPDRGLNGVTGTKVANIEQQRWFVDVAAKVLLPRFAQARKPFVLVFWSRDPDGSQHSQVDNPGALTPGINGPTSLAAIRNASDNLQTLRDTLARLGLDRTTDIVVTADHGFSTVGKESLTSPSARLGLRDVKPGLLPPGFLALDIARALDLPMVDADGAAYDVKAGMPPRTSGWLIGRDPAAPEVVVAANGGSDLIYLPSRSPALARRVVSILTAQDYTASLFVDDQLGPIGGTLPLSLIGLKGTALTPAPSLVVGFRSWTTGCAKPETCVVEIADTAMQQGQGTHGTFSRADTHNFMAAIGPDFRRGYIDPIPVSNVDLPVTLARILRLKAPAKGVLKGRVLTEALKGGAPVAARRDIVRSTPGEGGFVTVLDRQSVGGFHYFDAAGQPGRVFGLTP